LRTNKLLAKILVHPMSNLDDDHDMGGSDDYDPYASEEEVEIEIEIEGGGETEHTEGDALQEPLVADLGVDLAVVVQGPEVEITPQVNVEMPIEPRSKSNSNGSYGVEVNIEAPIIPEVTPSDNKTPIMAPVMISADFTTGGETSLERPMIELEVEAGGASGYEQVTVTSNEKKIKIHRPSCPNWCMCCGYVVAWAWNILLWLLVLGSMILGGLMIAAANGDKKIQISLGYEPGWTWAIVFGLVTPLV
jgi:hypothetical protein